MGGTLWFWVIILFTSMRQSLSKIRSRIHPLLSTWIRISKIYAGWQPWDGYIKWENGSWISVKQTEPGFTSDQTRSNSRAHLPLQVRQPDPTLVRISSETGQNSAFGSIVVIIFTGSYMPGFSHTFSLCYIIALGDGNCYFQKNKFLFQKRKLSFRDSRQLAQTYTVNKC